MKDILNEIKRRKNIVLFIDEFHTIMGAGSSEGSMDIANILKPELSRGNIKCIGATTNKEYYKYVAKDSALTRRFQIIRINEPSVANTLLIIKSIKNKYEKYHNVVFTSESLLSAIKLSDQYITDRNLPDKAIDIIDEVAAKNNIKKKEYPMNIKKMYDKINNILSMKNNNIKLQNFKEVMKIENKYIK